MKRIHFLAFLSLALLLLSCEKKSEYASDRKELMMADTVAPYMMSSEAANNQNDSNRSFIRTADLKFKVKDVRNNSIDIEKIIISNGGFITYTHLRSERIRNRKIPMYNDSVMQLTQFYLVNDLEFRIPVSKLHETLLSIGNYAEFIDYRIIEAKDKTWDILRNTKSQQRLTAHTKRLSTKIKNQKDKILETNDAFDRLLYDEATLDNAELDQLIWADEIAYSTVKVHLYERDQLLKEFIVDENHYKEVHPELMKEASYNFHEGVDMAKAIFLFLLRIWPLVLLFAAISIFYYKVKFKGQQ